MTCWRCGQENCEYEDGHSCVAIDGAASFTVHGSHAFITNPIIGVCPKHGPVTASVIIHEGMPHPGKYCQACWCDWIAATLPKLTPYEP